MNILLDNLESLLDAPNRIEKSRELILHLAVQGKIEKQDSNDEESELLVKRIKGKNLKQISDHPEIIKSGLPKGWCWQIIENIVLDNKHSIKRGPFGSSIKKDFFVPKGIKVYEQKHAIRNNFEIGSYFINEDKYQGLKAFEVKPNDIIISCSGTIGKVAIVPENAAKGIINQALLKLSLNTKVLLNEYFLILFPAYFMKTETLDDLKGTARKNIVSVKELKSLPFPLPPLNEQKRIVKKINSLMALLDELEEKREWRNQKRIKLNNASLDKLLTSKDDKELKTSWKQIEDNFSTLYSVPENVGKLKQAILQLEVQGKLVKQNPKDEPASELLKKINKEKEKLIAEGKIKKQKELPPIKDEEKPFEIPKGWEWVRLAEITKVIAGYGFDSHDFNSKDGVKCIKITNAGVHKIVESEDFLPISYKEKFKDFLLNTDDIILALTRPYIVDGLKVCKIPESYNEALLNQRVAAIKNISKLNFDYLFQFLCSDFVLNKYKSRFQKSGLQPNLKMEDLTMLEIPIPPLNEQKRIVEKVNELISLCNALEEKLTKKEATAEKLVGAVVNAIANKSNESKDDKEKVIKDLLDKYKKGLEKLS